MGKTEKLMAFEELLPEFLELLSSVCRSSDWCLDLGTGQGRVAFALSERSRWTLGIDSVPRRIEEARCIAQNNGIANVQFIVGDLENMQYTDLAPIGVFQVIATNLCFSREILARSVEALDNAGYLAGTCLSEDNWSHSMGFQESHFTEAGLREMLTEAGLKALSIARVERDVKLKSVDSLVKDYLQNYPLSITEDALARIRDEVVGDRAKSLKIRESKLVFCARKS